jgi:hypothetical protein
VDLFKSFVNIIFKHSVAYFLQLSQAFMTGNSGQGSPTPQSQEVFVFPFAMFFRNLTPVDGEEFPCSLNL